MNKINYDFSTFIEVFNRMKDSCTATPEDLTTLKTELDRFFNDSKCKEVIYTNNVDKMFFGIKLLPMIDADDIFTYLVDDEKCRIDKYMVEFDSKLFDPILDLTPYELLATLLHEVSNLIGDSSPIEDARSDMNSYLALNRDHIKISTSIHYKEILAYGLKDYVSKARSMFYTSDITDILSDEFAASYDLSKPLVDAYTKISANNMKLYENSEVSKFITFGWTLGLYKSIKTRRIGAMKTLTRAKELTGSRLEKLEMDNVIKRIQRIDDDSAIMESSITSGLRSKIKEKLRKARLNNLKTIDGTFYELSMQIKNVEDENDALFLMRQINNNIAIIDEYRNSKDCDDYERERCNEIYDKFIQLRDKLSSTVVYKNKNYGLFVNYPDIVENRY